ncbi:MAG: NusG domain II-containing protein [Anaeroplasmataceae bacterium]|nr:NusG domain II-containing protein [Anaeroplasmataceae bacterium]
MRKYKNDFILIGSLLLIAILGLVLYFSLQKKDNLRVYVYYNKELVETIDIRETKEIVVNDVVILVDNGSVSVQYSTCKDQICVHQGKIQSAGQTITCLPQRVFIQIEGSGVDVGI